MRKRRPTARRRTRETVYEWERGWDLAMARIDGVPMLVEQQTFFQDCLGVLNGAFADGDKLRFELGVRALVDFCNEVIAGGDCEQWWRQID
jgi:hypothetical protein